MNTSILHNSLAAAASISARHGRATMRRAAAFIAYIILLCAPLTAYADDVSYVIEDTKALSVIDNDLNTLLAAAISGDVITVTGSKNISSGSAYYGLSLNIPSGVTVQWQATLTNSSSIFYLINLPGDGLFEVAGGVISNTHTDATTNTYNAIYAHGSVASNVKVSGGEVYALRGMAIWADGSVTVEVSGGKVTSPFKAIESTGSGAVTVSGGEVWYTSTGAFSAINASSSTDVNVSGGKVGSEGGYAISGGQTVTVSGNAEISGYNNAAIYTFGNVNVLSGTVTNNTGSPAIRADGANSAITVSGGVVNGLRSDGANALVTVTGGKVTAEGNYTAINLAHGSADIQGGEVTAENGAAIRSDGDNATVTVSGGKVSNSYSAATIRLTGADCTVTISGGEVSNEDGTAILADGTDCTVTVNGTGLVQAAELVAGSGVEGINTKGAGSSVTVSGSGRVLSSDLGIYTEGVVTVSGGELTGGNYAILCNNNSDPCVTVSGGKLWTDGGYAAIQTDGGVVISGGEVSNTTGYAIYSNSTTAKTLSISGGIISSTTGTAILFQNSPINVSGGVVFSYGSTILGNGNVVYEWGGTLNVSGNGIVAAWNQAAGNSGYTAGDTDDLTILPASGASAVWNSNGAASGISYANGANSGFLSVAGVTVSGSADTDPPALTSGAVTRTSDAAATVSFTSNEAGKYYYQLDGAAPANAGALVTAGTNETAMTAAEQTVSLSSLTAGAHTLYIAAKDAAGNVSSLLTVNIPAFSPVNYNPGDIAVINSIIATNGLQWTTANPADGSYVPADWTGVTWSSAATNKRITELSLSANNLTGNLDVSGLTDLQALKCNDNDLSALTVGNLSDLWELQCQNNKLSSLVVIQLTALKNLYCQNNQLRGLLVSGMSALEKLNCSNNHLTQLVLTGTSVNTANFDGTGQTHTIDMTSSGSNYTAAVLMTFGTTFGASELSLSGTTLTSTNSSAESSTFTGPTSITNCLLSGTLSLVYPPVITTASLPACAYGEDYSQTLAADGTAPVTWSYTGTLPPELSLDASTGVISGTPTSSGTYSFGTYNFTVLATNSAGSDSKPLSITISKGTASVTTAPTAALLTYNGNMQALLSDGGTASGGTLKYSLTSGSGYTATIPDGRNANNYTVYYRAPLKIKNTKKSVIIF